MGVRSAARVSFELATFGCIRIERLRKYRWRIRILGLYGVESVVALTLQ